MDCFMHELREFQQVRRSLGPGSTAQENSVNSQSLSVQIRVAVEQEIRVEAKSDGKPNKAADKNENKRNPHCSKQYGEATPNQRNMNDERSHSHRSRSRDRTQSYRTPKEHHRRKDRNKKKRSRRRRDSSTDRDSGHRSRSITRRRHDYSTDKEDRKRSRRLSRHRCDYSADRECGSRNERRRTQYRVDSGRSRSRCDSFLSVKDLNKSRNDRNSRNAQLDESADVLNKSPKMFATDYKARSDVTNAVEATHNNVDFGSYTPPSTVTSTKISPEEYHSKMSKTQGTVSNGNDICTEESIQSNFELNFDESIFNKIVSTALSTFLKDSNLNDNLAPSPNDAEQNMHTNPHMTNIQIAQLPAVRYETLFDQIKDPRLQKMIQTQAAKSYEQKPHQQEMQTLAAISYEHKPQQQEKQTLAAISYEHKPHQQEKQPSAAISYEHKPHQQKKQTSAAIPYDKPQQQEEQPSVCSWGKMKVEWRNFRGETEEKSTATTNVEYEKQQACGNSSETDDKAKISELTPTPKAVDTEMIFTKTGSESVSSPMNSEWVPSQKGDLVIKLKKVKRKEVLEVHRDTNNKQKAKEEIVILREQQNKIEKKNKTKSRDRTRNKHATTHKRHETNEINSEHKKVQKEAAEKQPPIHEEDESVKTIEGLSVAKLEKDQNATVNEEMSSTLNKAFSALKKLVDPQHLRTIVDIMEQVTQNNASAEVKEELRTRTIEENTTAVGLESTTNGSTSNSNQKKAKKNESDKLHEDINNMFIRDGVLNINDRRRNISKKRSIEYSMIDSDDSEAEFENPSPRRQASNKKGSRKKTSSKKSPGKIKKQFRSSATTVNDSKMSCDGVDSVVRLAPVMQTPRVKNNNLEWHSLKNVLPCQLCSVPPGNSLISHYVNFHPNAEVLNSRLSPEAAQCLRSSTDFPQCEEIRSGTTVVHKQFCYFCNTSFTLTRQDWVSHMIRHTGYFNFKCNGCSRKFSTKALYHSCRFPNSVVEKTHHPIFQQENITAYVCELCNYVRFYEHEMEMHLNNEHDVNEVREFKKLKFFTLPAERKIGRPRKA